MKERREVVEGAKGNGRKERKGREKERKGWKGRKGWSPQNASAYQRSGLVVLRRTSNGLHSPAGIGLQDTLAIFCDDFVECGGYTRKPTRHRHVQFSFVHFET
jgi:hypothetical protein